MRTGGRPGGGPAGRRSRRPGTGSGGRGRAVSRRRRRKMPGVLAAVIIAGIFLGVSDPGRELLSPEIWEGWLSGREEGAGSPGKAFRGEPPGCEEQVSLEDIPAYSGDPYVVIDGNEPDFEESDITRESFEYYSSLDSLGRCGTALANVGQDLMPEGERESISQVKPTGWQSVKYEFVDGESLYNRCHLIGYQLTGENANEKNLITGTRYMNVEGMLPFENQVADYVRETDGHVLYRVTPVFSGDDLVAEGVEMEGYSVEDQGESVSFHVFVYNVQPGVAIDYDTGKSRVAG